MGNYYVPIVDILLAAGQRVLVDDVNEGWERRSRSTGGFDAAPLAVQWHNTASNTSRNNDLNYMIHNADDRPIGNVYLDREGVWSPIAGGAANTSGKGGPNTFSRGTCPKDSGNKVLFSIEAANDGTGGPWPQVMIDAYFAGSNAFNAHFGNRPDDVVTHALGSGDGYTDRKIDPGTANAVQGPWKPRSTNSSGTWSQEDLRAECLARAFTPEPGPTPIPPPDDEDDMPKIIYAFREYSNTWSEQGIHLSPEAYVALVAQGAVVVTSELTWPMNHHLDSLLKVSGLTPDYLVPGEHP
jgi:hypothetical protein